jgi:hypothetical protein
MPEQIDTVPTDEELEQRRREERTVALVLQRPYDDRPPSALLLDRGEAAVVCISVEYFGLEDTGRFRIVETPEALAGLYQNVNEFDAAVLAPISERRPFRDQARAFVEDVA